jgi:hypothetical protein
MRFTKCSRLCPSLAWRATFADNSLQRIDNPVCGVVQKRIRDMDACPDPEKRRKANRREN